MFSNSSARHNKNENSFFQTFLSLSCYLRRRCTTVTSITTIILSLIIYVVNSQVVRGSSNVLRSDRNSSRCIGGNMQPISILYTCCAGTSRKRKSKNCGMTWDDSPRGNPFEIDAFWPNEDCPLSSDKKRSYFWQYYRSVGCHQCTAILFSKTFVISIYAW